MTILTTRKDYEALPEGAPFELHDGVLVKQPSPRYGHQRLQVKVLAQLLPIFGADGRVVAGPVDVLIDELTVLVPDLVVLPAPPDDDAQYVGVPVAVFEIASLSTRGRDREFKARRYLGLGVKEVWLIDGAEGVIDIVTCNGTRRAEGAQPAVSDVLPGLRLLPEELFARASS